MSLLKILSKLRNMKRFRMLGAHAAVFLANNLQKKQGSSFVLRWPLAKDPVAKPKWTGC